MDPEARKEMQRTRACQSDIIGSLSTGSYMTRHQLALELRSMADSIEYGITGSAPAPLPSDLQRRIDRLSAFGGGGATEG